MKITVIKTGVMHGVWSTREHTQAPVAVLSTDLSLCSLDWLNHEPHSDWTPSPAPLSSWVKLNTKSSNPQSRWHIIGLSVLLTHHLIRINSQVQSSELSRTNTTLLILRKFQGFRCFPGDQTKARPLTTQFEKQYHGERTRVQLDLGYYQNRKIRAAKGW